MNKIRLGEGICGSTQERPGVRMCLMKKVSLVARRQDRSRDFSTRASERARQRKDAEEEGSQEYSSSTGSPGRDLQLSVEEGLPTVDVDLSPGSHYEFEKLTADYFDGKDEADITAHTTRHMKDGKWELKVQLMPAQASRMLTSGQLAQILGVSVSTVYSLRKRGEIRGYKVGRGWRYMWSEVVESLSADSPGQVRG